VSSVSSVVLIFVLSLAGCRQTAGEPPSEGSRLLFAQVIDETEFLAQAGQVEGLALQSCWSLLASRGQRPAADPPDGLASMAGLLNSPEKHRGGRLAFRGKLLTIGEYTPAGWSFPAFPARAVKGLVLLPDGGLAAFHAPILTLAANEPAPKLPAPGAAVRVSGRFLKRWIAVDGSGNRYVVVPLLASGLPVELAGEEAGKLAKLEPAKGLMPIAEIEAPPVWSRPVVELGARGQLRLDGRGVSGEKLVAELAKLATAAGKTPLGESALVAVVLVDKDTPAETSAALEKSLPVKAVFRTQSGG
jgi:hypothetical protein